MHRYAVRVRHVGCSGCAAGVSGAAGASVAAAAILSRQVNVSVCAGRRHRNDVYCTGSSERPQPPGPRTDSRRLLPFCPMSAASMGFIRSMLPQRSFFLDYIKWRGVTLILSKVCSFFGFKKVDFRHNSIIFSYH